MKNLNKAIKWIMLLNFNSIAFATDWNHLIDLAPNLKKEVLSLDKNCLIKAEVVKLPNGKYRIIEFKSFLASKKPTIVISAKADSDLNDLCRSSVLLKNQFKAQLIIQTNPLKTNPILNTLVSNNNDIINEKEISIINQIENSIEFGSPQISFDKKQVGWIQYDYDAISKSKGRLITDYYEEILNSELQKSDDGVFYYDLTNRNALACDLMQGRLTFTVSRSAEYELGLPARKTWLDLDQYTSVYQNFWKLQPLILDLKLSSKQTEIADALSLGLSINSNVESDEILKTPNRLQKLLSSLKSDIKNLSPKQKAEVYSRDLIGNWMLNDEYTKPAITTIKQNLIIGNESIFVKYEN